MQRNRSGSLSGVGPGAVEMDVLRGEPLLPPGGRAARRPLTVFGPGVDVSFPNDPYLLPFMELEQPGTVFDAKAPTRITNELLEKRTFDHVARGTKPGLAANRQRCDRRAGSFSWPTRCSKKPSRPPLK